MEVTLDFHLQSIDQCQFIGQLSLIRYCYIFQIPKSLRFQNDKYLTGTGQKRRLSARRLRLHGRLDSKRILSRFHKRPKI